MQNRIEENQDCYSIFLGHNRNDYGVRIRLDKKCNKIIIDGNLPYYISNEVETEALKEFSQNITTLLNKIGNKESVL